MVKGERPNTHGDRVNSPNSPQKNRELVARMREAKAVKRKAILENRTNRTVPHNNKWQITLEPSTLGSYRTGDVRGKRR